MRKTLLCILLLLVVVGCTELPRVSKPAYSIAFDDPPPGLIWRGKKIEDQTILVGDPNVPMRDAIAVGVDGDMLLYGDQLLVDNNPYKMPGAHSLKYYSDGMTRLRGDVVIFTWWYPDRYPKDEVIADKPMPDWLEPITGK